MKFLTFDSAAYVARYAVKKIGGDLADDHYTRTDISTGELTYIRPEFCTMSRRPGIGRGFYDKYKSDLMKGFITVNGHKCSVPDFYINQFESDPVFNDIAETMKESRRIAADPFGREGDFDRLRVKESIKLRKLKQLPRDQL